MGSKIAEVRVRTSVVYIAACSVAIPLMFLLLAVADALQPGRQDFHLLDIAIALILFVPLGAVLLHFTIFGCSMDLFMVYHLRRFGGDLLVVDHPSAPAFDIYAPESTTQELPCSMPPPSRPQKNSCQPPPVS